MEIHLVRHPPATPPCCHGRCGDAPRGSDGAAPPSARAMRRALRRGAGGSRLSDLYRGFAWVVSGYPRAVADTTGHVVAPKVSDVSPPTQIRGRHLPVDIDFEERTVQHGGYPLQRAQTR